MRHAVAYAAVALTLALAMPAAAQEFKPPANFFGQKKPAPKPYIVDWGTRPSNDLKATTRPTVVCGMTLIPADPKVDPKMKVKAPERGAAFTMRVAPPTVCKAP